jgi:uncharacterized membrane protein
MSGNPVQVFIAAYASEDGASAALKKFRKTDSDTADGLIDEAAVAHTTEGRIDLAEPSDPGGRKWAKRGAIAGGLVGLIFPPSIIGTAFVGAAGGGIWGKIRDKGFKDEDLKSFGETLPPGSSAVIAVGEDRVLDDLQQGLEGYEGTVRHDLSADATDQIVAAAAAAADADGPGA